MSATRAVLRGEVALPLDSLHALTQDVEGTLRIGTRSGLEGEAQAYVTAIHHDADGDVWLATGGGGLIQLQQVIINLVINASDALDGHGQIGLRLAPAAEEGDQMACLSVSDNGPGIDPAIGDRVFEPFFTFGKTEGGTGLGLAISQGIVRQAGGRIGHRSNPGGGTVFEVLLPVRFADSNG